MQILSSIQGQTKVCGIFGHPVGHSFSPVLQNTLFRALQIPAVYTAFDVAPEHLPAAVQGAFAMGLWGLNITIPHKKEVMALLTGIDPLAAQIGAVNTLCRRENGFWGYNTDILGLKKCFALHGHCLSQAQVLVLGAGGAANAAAFLAASEGASHLYLANRTRAKAEALASQIQTHYPIPITVCTLDDLSALPKDLLVIQATSVGMGTWESPVQDETFWQKARFVVDIVYTPWETKTVHDARAQGATAVNGFEMLIYQGIASAELWHGLSVDDDTARTLCEALANHYQNRKDTP